MKTLLTLALLFTGLTASALTVKTPLLDPGLYQGVITVQRQVPDLKTTDTTTLLISGEVYYSLGNGFSAPLFATLMWTARNLDTSMKLANAWSLTQFGGTEFPENLADMSLPAAGITIPGGTLVSGSYKNTRTTLAWKCTKETTLFLRRKSISTTTFSISRVGSVKQP